MCLLREPNAGFRSSSPGVNTFLFSSLSVTEIRNFGAQRNSQNLCILSAQRIGVFWVGLGTNSEFFP